MVRIRRFNPDRDLLEIAKMANSILNEDYKLSMFTNVHEAWPDGFLIAETDEVYLGSIIAVMIEPEIARILVLVVGERYRRSGIATRLFKAFIQKASLRGAKKITLEVRMSNMPAIEFYRKYKFKIASTIPLYYRDGENAYVMERYV
jgi:ribosomal-protein-alanine N-acetyltransferase